MTAHQDDDHVAAVFTSTQAAETAIAELRSIGIADEHLGVALHEPGQRVFEDDVEHDEAVAIGEGALAGAPLGALAGMGLVALALPGIGTVAVGGLLAAGGAAGAIFGAFFGGLIGMTTADRELEERRRWEGHLLRPGEILVVARSHQKPTQVRTTLERHGGHVVPPHPPEE